MIQNDFDVIDKLAVCMDDLEKQEGFSGSVLVAREEETLLEKGYGRANIELDVPNTPQTRFRIGSITKPFTALCVMMLAERGDLRTEDTIETYLPDIPEAWKEITIHHLMAHTSGMMHSWTLPEFIKTMSVRVTPQEVIDRFKDEPLVFAPGTGNHYSGVGYFVLAQVIEQVAGKSWADFLQEEILDPAGMRDTGPNRYDLLLPGRASGYERTDQDLMNADPIFMPILTGGGNLYSTVGDLYLWDRALNEERLMSGEAFRQKYQTGQQRFGGSVSGFNAHLFRIQEHKICVVVLSNIRPTPVKAIASRLAGIVAE